MKNNPVVGEKVYLVDLDPVCVGIITKVFPPCENHSGRFIVHSYDKYMEWDYEFWFSDYGKSVIKESEYKKQKIKGSK